MKYLAKCFILIIFILSIASSSVATNAELDRGLFIAAAAGDIKTLQSLIENGADVNVRNNYGYTALRIAASKRDTKIAVLLIKFGAKY